MTFKKGNKIGIGRKPWNKGLIGVKTNNKGQIAWNKNKKGLQTAWNKGKKGTLKHTEEFKENAKIRMLNNNPFKGKHHSDITKKIISERLKGRNNSIHIGNKYHLGKKHNKDSITKIKESRAIQILPLQDTSIELKIQGFLTLLNIEYGIHKYISEIEHKYCCDIYIPSSKTIIECDGDYFHANPNKYNEDNMNIKQIEQKERDELRTKELQKKGFRVLRLWESDIKVMDLNKFREIVI